MRGRIIPTIYQSHPKHMLRCGSCAIRADNATVNEDSNRIGEVSSLQFFFKEKKK